MLAIKIKLITRLNVVVVPEEGQVWSENSLSLHGLFLIVVVRLGALHITIFIEISFAFVQ
jgi:hypothetical protein